MKSARLDCPRRALIEGEELTGFERLKHNIPFAMQTAPRFVLWRYEQSKTGKQTKVPYSDVGKRAATNKPHTWDTFNGALYKLAGTGKYFSGIGFVLGNGITGIDLDHVIQEDGTLMSEAAEIVNMLPGYVERSPSGTGLHILIRGALPAPGERDKLRFGVFEFYDDTSPRYLTLTGDVWEDRKQLNEDDATEAIAAAYHRARVLNVEKIERERDEKNWLTQAQREQREREKEQQKEQQKEQKQKEKKEKEEQKRKEKKEKEEQKERKREEKKVLALSDYYDDDSFIERIKRSKQGDNFSRLFDGGWKASGKKSQSEAVAALLITLAWWTNKDHERIDRIFRKSVLYDPQKWNRKQSGETLGSIEIRNACKVCQGHYDPLKPKQELKRNLLIEFKDFTDTGNPKATLANLEALLSYSGVKIHYDETKKISCAEFADGRHLGFSMDNQDEAILAEVMSMCELEDMPVSHLDQYLCNVADKNRRNPAREWITSKPWDKVDRLLPLCDTLTTTNEFPDDLKEIIVTKWLLSAVAAAVHDPRVTQFSTRGVLVLQGPQGIGKTRWLRRLAPQPWVRDGAVLDPTNKDNLMSALSYWIVELGELESTLAKDIGRLKAFLTNETDQLRVPFARRMSKYTRRTVFAASVNKAEFLIDKTGNDRFWVIPVIAICYDHNIDMQQVFAQLYEKWEGGAQWWLTRAEAMRLTASNTRFEEIDEMQELLMSCIDWSNYARDLELNCVDMMTATEVLLHRCKIQSIPTKKQANDCAHALRKITGRNSELSRENKVKGRRWPIPRGRN
jgi:putative DNA primase/helicase